MKKFVQKDLVNVASHSFLLDIFIDYSSVTSCKYFRTEKC